MDQLYDAVALPDHIEALQDQELPQSRDMDFEFLDGAVAMGDVVAFSNCFLLFDVDVVMLPSILENHHVYWVHLQEVQRVKRVNYYLRSIEGG